MAVAEQRLPTGSWSADPVHSSLVFEVEHLGLSTFRAGFTDYEVRLSSDSDGVELVGSAQLESLTVSQADLRAHLLSPDFFDVERHPQLRFASTSVTGGGDSLVVVGELTIRGVTRPVELHGRLGAPGEDPYGTRRVALELDGVIDRTEYGLGWNLDLPDGRVAVGLEVRLSASLELVESA